MESFLTVLGDLILSGKGQLMDPLFFKGLGLGGEISVDGISALCASITPDPLGKKEHLYSFEPFGNRSLQLWK